MVFLVQFFFFFFYAAKVSPRTYAGGYVGHNYEILLGQLASWQLEVP